MLQSLRYFINIFTHLLNTHNHFNGMTDDFIKEFTGYYPLLFGITFFPHLASLPKQNHLR